MKNRKTVWIDKHVMTIPSFIGLCVNENQFIETCRKLGIKPTNWILANQADATTHLLVDDRKRNVTIVCIKVRDDISGIQIAGLLVHEAVHIFQQYVRYIGEDYPSSEFQAYSIQQISQNLMEAYIQLTKVEK